MLKTYNQKEKIENSETYSTSHGPLSQEFISERYWFFTLICHVNQSYEYWNHIATFYQLDCIDKSQSIPGIKQCNINEQRNLLMKSQL